MSANERQVAGDHYRGRDLQHWDLMALFRVPYFEGQITKYVDRHRSKNGSQDLRKAHHFAEKLLEVRGQGDPMARCAAHFDPVVFAQFVRGSKLDARQIGVYLLALTWSSRQDLEDLVQAIDDYDVECYPPPAAKPSVPVIGIGDPLPMGRIKPGAIVAGARPAARVGTNDADSAQPAPAAQPKPEAGLLVGVGSRVVYVGSERNEFKGRGGVLVGVRVPRAYADASLDFGSAVADVLFDGVPYSFFNEASRVPLRDVAPQNGSWV